MPRLFTGLELPPDIAGELDLMKGGVPGARWVDPDSYHITLRFIGDIEEPVAREVALELDGVAFPAFTLRLKGVGAFGGAKPHSLHAGLADSPDLKRLQLAHERACQLAGLPPEPRKFSPHVTLARLRHSSPEDVQRYIAAHNLYSSRPFEVWRFVLFSARPGRGGGPYAVEESYPLRRDGANLADLRTAGARG
jgi:2'-5' RNA ligase